MFNFTDIIFTFGNEDNTKKIQNLGGKVSLSYSVGSLKAEHLMDNNLNDSTQNLVRIFWSLV